MCSFAVVKSQFILHKVRMKNMVYVQIRHRRLNLQIRTKTIEKGNQNEIIIQQIYITDNGKFLTL